MSGSVNFTPIFLLLGLYLLGVPTPIIGIVALVQVGASMVAAYFAARRS